MTISLKDLKHLEVMANLKNADSVTSKPVNIKALLASDAKKELTVSEKILSLCVKLRSEGFDKQAENLENRFLVYKSATTHLYRAFDEDGEDLINAAHPDGEVKVEDAQDGHGVVETVVTEHKKLIDKVNKMPTGKLAQYIEQTKQALYKEALADPTSSLAYNVYKFLEGTKLVFGDITEQAEILKSKLDALLSDDNTKKFDKLKDQINDIIPALNKVMAIGPQLEHLQVQPEGKLNIIKRNKTFLENLQNVLAILKGTIIAVHNATENSATSKVYHLFVSSNLIEAKVSIAELDKSLSKMIRILNSLDQSPTSQSSTTKVNLNLEDNDSNNVELEISKLNNWKEKIKVINIPEAKKQQAMAWVDTQIKEFQDHANNPAKVKELIEENKEFEHQINILEGKK